MKAHTRPTDRSDAAAAARRIAPAAGRPIDALPFDQRLEAALETIAAGASPALARRLRDALAPLLSGRGASAPGDWSGSTLTGTGHPVEIAFCSADRSLRFTCEVAPAAVPAERRLTRAVELARRLVGAAPDRRLIDQLHAAQAGRSLRYGAWLGGRIPLADHRRGAPRPSDQPLRGKLYVELPADAPPPSRLPAWLHDRLPAALSPRLRMLGLPLGVAGDPVEGYFDIAQPGDRPGDRLPGDRLPGDLLREALPAGDELVAALDAACGGRLVSALARRDRPLQLGCSLAGAAGGAPATITLYSFAEQLFGDDPACRRALLALAERSGWDLGLYRRLTRPLAERAGRSGGGPRLAAGPAGRPPSHHGIFGVTLPLTADGAAERDAAIYTIGLAPPAPVDRPSRLLDEVLDGQLASGAFGATVSLPGEDEAPEAGPTDSPDGSQSPPRRVAGDASCFTTALVVERLATLDEPAVPAGRLTAALDRALTFIERCRSTSHPGAFHFYPPGEEPAWLGTALPPDADDTALALLVLLRHGRVEIGEARWVAAEVLEPYRLHDRPPSAPDWAGPGVYLTWLSDGPGENPLDACVNANVASLLHTVGLTDHPGYRAATGSVLRAVRQGLASPCLWPHLAPYYAHPAELAAALDRGAAVGIAGFGDAAARLRSALSDDGERPLYCSADRGTVWTSEALATARSLVACSATTDAGRPARAAAARPLPLCATPGAPGAVRDQTQLELRATERTAS